MKKNSIALPKPKKTNKANSCTDWYWVTTYSNGTQTWTYLETTCDCDNYKAPCGGRDGGGGGGGSSSGTAGTTVVYPTNPTNNQLFTYIDADGEIVTEKYNAITKEWEWVSITLTPVVIQKKSTEYHFLQFAWPQPQQTVVQDNIVYTYNAASGNWVAEPKTDPCTGLRKLINSIAADTKFTAAVTSITAAESADGFEHSITLGRDSNGKITQAPMNNGTSQYLVQTNTTWEGAFAAIHNHPNGTPMSAGDIYSAVRLNTLRPNFTTTFLILPDGSRYALVVTDLEAAKKFVKDYPADQLPGYSPEFPDNILDEIKAIETSSIAFSSIEGKTQAIAFILDKYKAGMTLLKQDSVGDFYPTRIQETIQNGNKIYTPKPCN